MAASPPRDEGMRSSPASSELDLQAQTLAWLLRGASPSAACAQAGVASEVFTAWLTDPGFRRRLEESQHLLSRNVAAALYRSAMEGNVTAQSFYLKQLPPPEWPSAASTNAAHDPFAHLTDEELLERCRAHGIDVAVADVGIPGETQDPDQPG